MSLSPKDMDFIEAHHVAAREIALALGVPPMLLGIPGDNTYSNLAEAQRIFWRQTVLPLVNRTATALTNWLAPTYDPVSGLRPDTASHTAPLRLVPDLDAIEALSPERETLWARLEKTTFLTTNEKRAAIGYGPSPPADGNKFRSRKRAKFNPYHDELGRFTTADGVGGSGDGDLTATLIGIVGDALNDAVAPTSDEGDPNIGGLVHRVSDNPPLRRIHPDSTYERDLRAKSSLDFQRKQSTESIVESSKPGTKDSLKVKPDGTVMDGNTRLKVLEERGYATDKLPREIHHEDGRGGGGRGGGGGGGRGPLDDRLFRRPKI